MKKYFKRNFAIALVTAVMVVPAFGAINANAAYKGQNGTMLTQSEVHMIHPMTTGFGPGGGGKVEPWGHEEENGIGHYNGHTFELPDNGGAIVTKLDGIKNPSVAQVNAALNGTSNSSHATDTGDQSNETEQSNNNSQSEYQSSNTNNGKLVQTGERSTARKIGIVAVLSTLVAFVVAKIRKVRREN